MRHRIIKVTSEDDTYFIIQCSYSFFKFLGIWFTHKYEDSNKSIRYETLKEAKKEVDSYKVLKQVIINKEKVYETNNSNSRG